MKAQRMVIKTWLILESFNDTFSCMDYITSNDRVVLNNKLKNMWAEAAVTYLRYYTSINLERIRKPTRNLGICSLRESKAASSAYETVMPTTRPVRSLSHRSYRKTTICRIH